ncbi:MAG: PaaI family thioesterase [Chloroflexota bacterium]
MINWPRVSLDTDKGDDLCFGCGQRNPIGLKLQFQWDGQTARAEFTPQPYHQGWPGIVHGGVLACLVDEAFGWASVYAGTNCVNARMEMRLKRPARVGEPLVVTGTITDNKRKLLPARAELCLTDGTPVAEATATLYVVSQRDNDTQP